MSGSALLIADRPWRTSLALAEHRWTAWQVDRIDLPLEGVSGAKGRRQRPRHDAPFKGATRCEYDLVRHGASAAWVGRWPI
jgi:hypothetical protein